MEGPEPALCQQMGGGGSPAWARGSGTQGADQLDQLHQGEGSGWKLGWCCVRGTPPSPSLQEHIPGEMGTWLIADSHMDSQEVGGLVKSRGPLSDITCVWTQHCAPGWGPLHP